MGYAPGQGKRIHWDGLEVTSLDELRERSQVFIFVPESLLLVKGSPARRRAHLDAFAAALDPQYAAAARDLQAALRQRNAQLQAVKLGASPAALEPWDVQFAAAAATLGRRRRDLVSELATQFADTAAALAPAGQRFALQLVAQLEGVGYDEAALRDELRRRRPGEVQRGLSMFGPHRDDLRFLEVDAAPAAPPPAATTSADGDAAADEVRAGGDGSGEQPPWQPEPGLEGPAVDASCALVQLPRGGRDLRLFGSQGEQRAVVLALLLAEQRLAVARTGEHGTLFLDDVMSELDHARRRRLVAMLSSAGQAIITTTDRHYFTEQELAQATVIDLPLAGSLHDDRDPGLAHDPRPADALGAGEAAS